MFYFFLIHEIPIGLGAPTATETPYQTYRVVSRSRAKLVGRVNRSAVNGLGSYRPNETAYPETTRFFTANTTDAICRKKKKFIEFLSSDVRVKVGNNYIAVVYWYVYRLACLCRTITTTTWLRWVRSDSWVTSTARKHTTRFSVRNPENASRSSVGVSRRRGQHGDRFH